MTLFTGNISYLYYKLMDEAIARKINEKSSFLVFTFSDS